MRIRIHHIAVLILAVFLSGCAVGRSVVAPTMSGAVENPVTGPEVKVVAVNDHRIFAIKPHSPNIPSLQDDQIHNKAVTSRAIGRKRGGFGAALGDVLLPEGQTVSDLVGAAVEDGLRRAGYRVLKPGDGGYANAEPVTVDITRFWNWIEPGAFVITVRNQFEIKMQGTIAADGNQVVSGQRNEGMQMVVEDDWRKMTQAALAQISSEVTDGFRIK